MKTNTEARFYLNEKGQLFFYMKASSTADRNAQPFEFDGPATERQKKDYALKYEEFLKAQEPKE